MQSGDRYLWERPGRGAVPGSGRSAKRHRQVRPWGRSRSGAGRADPKPAVERRGVQAPQPHSWGFAQEKGSGSRRGAGRSGPRRGRPGCCAGLRINGLWSIRTTGRRGKLRVWREPQKRDAARRAVTSSPPAPGKESRGDKAHRWAAGPGARWRQGSEDFLGWGHSGRDSDGPRAVLPSPPRSPGLGSGARLLGGPPVPWLGTWERSRWLCGKCDFGLR